MTRGAARPIARRVRLRTIAAAFALTALVGTASAKAPPPISFCGLAWGSPPPSTLRSLGRIGPGEELWTSAGQPAAPFLDVPVTAVTYTFADGRLFAGTLYVAGYDHFAKLAAALVARYGAPDHFDARLPLYRWWWPEQRISIELYEDAPIQRATLSIESDRRLWRCATNVDAPAPACAR